MDGAAVRVTSNAKYEYNTNGCFSRANDPVNYRAIPINDANNFSLEFIYRNDASCDDSSYTCEEVPLLRRMYLDGATTANDVANTSGETGSLKTTIAYDNTKIVWLDTQGRYYGDSGYTNGMTLYYTVNTNNDADLCTKI